MPTIEELDTQIRALEDQKKVVIQKAKDAALGKANAAIEDLRKMGFSYRLTEGGAPARTPTATGDGTRRTGQRDNVLTTVSGAGPDGISASDVLSKMGASSDADKTSIRNALSALKRHGKIGLKDGKYAAA